MTQSATQSDDLDSVLNPKLRTLLPDPSHMADMDKAVVAVRAALAAQKKIAIYGDYDVDGISTSALIQSYLQKINVPSQVFLPDRQLDGYGLNQASVQKMVESGIGLLITVDCGAKDIKALTYAADAGMPVVVLDHHPTETAPPTAAFVNPNGPNDTSGLGTLTAGGVAFMFLVGLNRARAADKEPTPDLMQFLDLVALSTICDVAPLTGLNRAFVVRGLELLQKQSSVGITALARSAGMRGKPNVESFSFGLGPRLNAAGRIGKADLALELLTCQDKEQAEGLAAQLNTLNRKRQSIEKKMLAEARARLLGREVLDSNALVVASDDWHSGVIGIVAARLKDSYERTAVVIALDGETGTGSIRSDGRLDLANILEEGTALNLLLRGGGHPQAAGFTIARDKIDDFTAFFMERAASAKSNAPPVHQIDGKLDFSFATRALYEDLQKAAPFGKGWAAPCMLWTDGCLQHSRVSANGHLRCTFRPVGGGAAIEVVGFGHGASKLGQKLQAGTGEVFHIVGSLRPAWKNMVSGVEIALADAALPEGGTLESGAPSGATPESGAPETKTQSAAE